MIDDLLFSANAVLPIILLIALGYVLKRIGMLTGPFLDVGNKLTFRVLLPVMLFMNVYGINSFSEINIWFVLYGMAAVIVIFAAAIPIYCAFTKDPAKRGSLMQSMFRSNYAIIGIPLAQSLFPENGAGAAAAAVMSAFCVPLFNVLAVVTLSIYNGNSTKSKIDVKKILLGIVKNPLIIGTVAGLAALGIRELLVLGNIDWRLSDIEFLYTSLNNVKSICTPFALIILGGKFEFSAVGRLKKEIIFGTFMRVVTVPVLGLLGAYLLMPLTGISGEHFATYIGVFGTPVAVASAIMAKEMGANADLAGQLVVWTSLISAVTIFIYVTILRSIGIF